MTIDNFTGGSVEFRQTSSAGDATINNNIGTGTGFFNNSHRRQCDHQQHRRARDRRRRIQPVQPRQARATINNGGFSCCPVQRPGDAGERQNHQPRTTVGALLSSQSSAGTALASITNNDFGQVHFINRSTAGSATIIQQRFRHTGFQQPQARPEDATIVKLQLVRHGVSQPEHGGKCLHHHQE